MYGITETTVHVTTPTTHKKEADMPGAWQSDWAPHSGLADPSRWAWGPVPVGVTGELHRGAGVARGIGTARNYGEAVLCDPFVVDGGRMYKTGTWGVVGGRNVDYLGHNDFQVKIRGFRIEAGR
jgi:non-ribosomal peptide synthetase component F